MVFAKCPPSELAPESAVLEGGEEGIRKVPFPRHQALSNGNLSYTFPIRFLLTVGGNDYWQLAHLPSGQLSHGRARLP